MKVKASERRVTWWLWAFYRAVGVCDLYVNQPQTSTTGRKVGRSLSGNG
jgi:hypothetical protein